MAGTLSITDTSIISQTAGTNQKESGLEERRRWRQAPVIEDVVHEIAVFGLKTRVANSLGEAAKYAFLKLRQSEGKAGFHLSGRGERTGNPACPRALTLISLYKTSTYNEGKSASLPHVSKVSPLAGVSHAVSDGDILNCRYNDTMKKTWVYKRKGVKNWWCGWYEGGKRKAKALPTKALAEHFRNIKYAQLNSDVFTSVVDFNWQQMVNEYHHIKQVEGLQEVSTYEALLTLRHFERLVGLSSSRQITQQSLDTFVLERGKEVKRDTLNKDIRNISAFLNWAMKNRYVASGLEIKKVKVSQKPVIALSPQQVRNIIKLVSDYPTLRLRILLAVTTGLRRGDIEAIRIGDIHFDRNTITTRNRKAKKAMAERPIPEQIMTELSNYVATLPDGQELLFTDRFPEKRWKKVRRKVELPDLKFHDLRKTFASLLAQRGVSTAVTQKLLEHSSPKLTNDVYTNIDPVLRQAINLLPVAEWL